MKSPMMTLYAAKKDPLALKMKGADDPFYSYSSTSGEGSYDEDSSFDAVGSVVLQDRGSETDSSKKYPSCRRSKRVIKSRTCDLERMEMEGFFRVKKSKSFGEEKGKNVSIHCCNSFVETEPLSSILDRTPEEDVAYCLIMLSKDKWERDHDFEYRARIRIEDEVKRGEDDYSEDFQKVTTSNKVRGKYICEACNKLFRSYQALGGHRASHAKIGGDTGRSKNSGGGSKAAAAVEDKVHECAFCPRVFKSGQALGGHKRTHFLGISRNVIETVGPLMVKPFSRI
ncbi:zinc finger protein ZAT9 [Primulina eburnea]|uniref:zinc finger protein ZAT9 n=1 Tax=Primulina eburnea TaxID=1245227 RepID=UPI003C6C87F6